MPESIPVDINEDALLRSDSVVMAELLRDHTTRRNIIWATDDYAHLGEGFSFADPIAIDHITGPYINVIRPRALKSREQQRARAREKAEVFTPSWICNAQNNLIDEAWFGRKDVFNTEIEYPDGTHSWDSNPDPITYPKGKTWRDYVRDTRLEITCGEAPYLVSRYDTTTGEAIPLNRRIGLLDRKLRVISENTSTTKEWLDAAQIAYMNTYGYEWQGDNLLLAREALFVSFLEYFQAKFGRLPVARSQKYIAYITSWNLWQMDGLKGVIPMTCGDRLSATQNLFGETEETITPCEGCRSNDIRRHNGTYALIRDWSAKAKERRKLRYIDLIK
ncbi:MAG: restriction endonuclease subunit M [Bacteroidales bacterium]|nr:restriction endonuclease subunit M [Bacteroidales bacterium]